MKRADLWLRKNRAGKPLHWKWKTVNLRTLDATEARARSRLAKAGKWPPPEDKAAAVSVESFSLPADLPPHVQKAKTAIVDGLQDAGFHVTETPADPSPAGPAAPPSDWTQAATAASAEASAPIMPEVVNPAADAAKRAAEAAEENAELAKTIVGGILWGSEFYCQRKIFEGFRAPVAPDEMREELAKPYRKMLDYGGANVKLPPWVHGLLLPAASALISAAVIAKMYGEMARQQKAQAEATKPVAEAA